MAGRQVGTQRRETYSKSLIHRQVGDNAEGERNSDRNVHRQGMHAQNTGTWTGRQACRKKLFYKAQR